MSYRALRLAGLALAFAATVSFADAGTARAATIKMVFPGPATSFGLPLYVAQKKGWLGDLKVEELAVTGDSNAMRALISGSADIALVGTLNVLTSLHAGTKVRAINSWQPIGDYNLVLAKGKGTTMKDLAGKSFATSGPGALPDQLPRLVMKKYGIDDSASQFVQVGGHSQRLQVVLGGRADATLINTITAMRGVQQDKITVLTRISKEFPGLGYVWNVVRTESLEKPELAAAFQTLTEAGIKGSRYIMENPDDAAEIMHERLPDMGVDYLKAVIRDLNTENLWGVDGGLDPKIEQFTAKLNKDLGNLPVAAEPKDVLEPRFVEAALKKLGPAKK